MERRARQLWDGTRIAARVDAINRVAVEERLSDRAVVAAVGRRVDALHLVVHDALVRERRVRRLRLVVPTLLLKRACPDIGVQDARVEHGIEVDVAEVVKVLPVLRGDGVHRLVGSSHRVEERLQRAFEKFDERLLQRILARAAQHRVLKDVRHASCERGSRADQLLSAERLRGQRLAPDSGSTREGARVRDQWTHCRLLAAS